MKKLFILICIILVLITNTACGTSVSAPENESAPASTSSESEPITEEPAQSEPLDGSEAESSEPEEPEPNPEPLSCEEFFSRERYLPKPLEPRTQYDPGVYYYVGKEGYTGADGLSKEYGELSDHNIYRLADGVPEKEPFLEGDYLYALCFDEWLYMYEADGTLSRLRLPDGEPETICVLDLKMKPWRVYGEVLIVGIGEDGLYTVYIPTGDVRKMGGNYPGGSVSPADPFPPKTFWILTNQSYCWQYSARTEEDVLEYRNVLLCCGSTEMIYEVTSGMETVGATAASVPEDITAFFPLDENGVPLLGDNFVEFEQKPWQLWI